MPFERQGEARVLSTVLQTDVLVVGAGGAGCRAAYEALRAGSHVTLLLKGKLGSSGATAYKVQDAAAFQAATGEGDPSDSPQAHFNDIMAAGLGVCDPRLATILAEESPALYRDLTALGLPWIRGEDGRPFMFSGAFTKTLRAYRMPDHARPIVNVLGRELRRLGCSILEDTMATRLIVSGGRCTGVLAYSKQGETLGIQAKAVVLATGGHANLFYPSLFPPDVTGDGYVMALEAGAELLNVEFLQLGVGSLHPLSAISGYVWGLQPRLLNGYKEPFLDRHLPSRLTATDVLVAKAGHWPFSTRNDGKYLEIVMHQEFLAGHHNEHDAMYLDHSVITERRLATMPTPVQRRWSITKAWWAERAIDLSKDLVQVALMSHSCNGGIRISESGQTRVPGLFAAGEAAGGVNGADRLGGNMVNAGQVFGRRAGLAAAAWAKSQTNAVPPRTVTEAEERRSRNLLRQRGSLRCNELKRRIQSCMTRVMIVRDESSLNTALSQLTTLERDLSDVNVAESAGGIRQYLEIESLLKAAHVFLVAARERRESRGPHYRQDFPTLDEALTGKLLVISSSNGAITSHWERSEATSRTSG